MTDLLRYFKLMAEMPELFDLPVDAPWQIETKPSAIQTWSQKQPEILKEIGVLWEDAYYIILRDLIVTTKGQTFGHLRFLEKGCLKGNRAVAALPMIGGQILLKVIKLSVPEFEAWLNAGKITDGFTIATYAMAKAKGLL